MALTRVRQWFEGKAIDIDIFLAESPFQHSAMARRIRVDLEVATVWIVSAEDLVLFKLLANRPRDIGDILDIFLAHGQLDEDYLQSWASNLNIQERLNDVRSKYHE